MKKLIAAAFMLIATSFSPLVFADVEKSEISLDKIKITFSTEDARTELGRKEIEKQIRKAAEQVCGEQELRRVGSLTQVAENRRCYARAIQSGMQALDRVA
jgi:UrcA family protein